MRVVVVVVVVVWTSGTRQRSALGPLAHTGDQFGRESGHNTHSRKSWIRHGATRGVMVSISAFLACHQCYCAGSSLAWGLNLRAVVCGIF